MNAFEQKDQPTAAPSVRENAPTGARRRSRRTASCRYETLESAAAQLGLDPGALRARCRRAAVREGRDVRAYLGGGIVAFKFGRTWRVCFPQT